MRPRPRLSSGSFSQGIIESNERPRLVRCHEEPDRVKLIVAVGIVVPDCLLAVHREFEDRWFTAAPLTGDRHLVCLAGGPERIRLPLGQNIGFVVPEEQEDGVFPRRCHRQDVASAGVRIAAQPDGGRPSEYGRFGGERECTLLGFVEEIRGSCVTAGSLTNTS